ncbi:alpha/beta-hydrolase family protein, partial [Kineosporia sp. R_H_3]|uniref:alpha/beta-hydrolase family protein n=1 Tax=Kineosporia sp. R_H_3 TaxID=1961848 RepID=UPI00350F1F96
MLPHPWWVQVPLGALVVLQGYGLGLLVRAGARRCGPWLVGRVGGTAATRVRAAGTAVGVATSVVLPAAAFVVGHRGGAALSLSVGTAPTTWHEDLAVALAPVVVAVAVIGVLRLARRGLRAARRPYAHRRPAQVLTASALTVAVLSAASAPTAAMAGTGHDGAGPGTAREAARSTPVVDAPLVAGTKRADFLAPRSPCDRPGGGDPVRVYVGQDEAATAAGRAVLAADALARAGAFDRPAILVAVPTGSGWVNQSAVCAVEGLYAGDVASVAVQYSARPSWLAYLSGGEGARASVRALFAELRRRVDARPPGSRPRLLVYGESLGAWAGLSAFPGSGGLGGGAAAAVW